MHHSLTVTNNQTSWKTRKSFTSRTSSRRVVHHTIHRHPTTCPHQRWRSTRDSATPTRPFSSRQRHRRSPSSRQPHEIPPQLPSTRSAISSSPARRMDSRNKSRQGSSTFSQFIITFNKFPSARSSSSRRHKSPHGSSQPSTSVRALSRCRSFVRHIRGRTRTSCCSICSTELQLHFKSPVYRRSFKVSLHSFFYIIDRSMIRDGIE